jgi:membrane protein DedA with SNARE-associated domain
MAMVSVTSLIARHGYWIVGATVGLESMGIPLPGETILVSAAVYAGATHQLDIFVVVLAAAIGGIAGDNAGFLIGRRLGYPLLVRYAPLLRITPARIKLGRFLFLRHGGKLVFFARFVAVLRALGALLAGVNCMPWRRFLVFNAAGAVAWAGGYGMLAYLFGERVERFTTLAGIAIVAGAIACALMLIWLVRRHEARLAAEAERLLPGPLL